MRLKNNIEMKYDDILFDLDGTLTESAEGIVNSVMYTLDRYGIAVRDRNELYRFVGPPLAEMFASYCGFSAEEGRKAVEVYREYYAKRGIFENRLYDGIAELLADLKKSGRRIFLATSKPEIFAKKILEHYGVIQYFNGVVGSELNGARTDKSEIIALVKEKFGIGNAVMVGDRCYDVSGSQECGLPCIGVLYGYGSREELDGAAAIAETVAELGDMLLKE